MVIMKNAFGKNLIREIRNTITRFLSIMVIVAIGVAFFGGIRATCPDMKLTADKYLDENKMADIRILSSLGFTDEDVAKIKKIKGVSDVVPGYTFDALAVSRDEEKPVKVHSIAISAQGSGKSVSEVNKPVLVEGNLPENEDECITEKGYLNDEGINIGDYIELKTQNGSKKFKITGVVNSPMYINTFERGNNSLGSGKSAAFFQIGEKSAAELSIPEIPGMDRYAVYTELSVIIDEAKEKNTFMDEYKDVVEPVKSEIQELSKNEYSNSWYVFDMFDNESVYGYMNDADRIGAVGEVFPLIFFFVAALVCLTSMTRMVEEHRTQMGVLKALGYGKLSIISQYFLYAFTASIAGSIIGAPIGFRLFPTVIFNAYRVMYNLPAVVTPFNMSLAITSTLVAVISTTAAAVMACIKELTSAPAELMRPRAPKAGKRIFLERIGFIWRRMSFTKKVTARNIFRYKKRFLMTVIGIAGCTGLLVTGFGLKDSILSITDIQFNDIYVYNLIGYLKQPVTGEEADLFKAELDRNSYIEKLMLLFQQSISVGKSGSNSKQSNVYITVPEDNKDLKKFIKLRMNDSDIDLPDDGVVITQKLSKMLDVKKGEYIDITLGDKTVQCKVRDITEHYVWHYIYMSKQYYNQIFNMPVKFNGFASITNTASQGQEEELSKELMKNSNINSLNFTTNFSDNFRKSMRSLDSVIFVLILSAAALAFVVMYNLTNINITERIRELATIKVLGFYDKELASYIYRENIILSLIGTAAGLILGIFLHKYVIATTETDIVMFGRNINSVSFIYSAILTLIFAGTVNVFMYGRFTRINMVESLKSAE